MLVIFVSQQYVKHSAGMGIHAKIHYGNSTMVTTPHPTGTTPDPTCTTTGGLNATLGEQCFCSTQNPCDINEGHCTADNQCMGDLMCGNDNCLPILGFANGTNCCYGICRMVDMKNGILTSPNYPDFYLNNLDCADQITVEEGKIITIEFDTFWVRSV